jgi:hypothetical protein
MSAGSAGSAPKRRIDRWLRREQRDHRAGGIASRRDLVLSFIHSARMGRAYGKCRLKEAIATIAKEGIRTFVVPESDQRTLH